MYSAVSSFLLRHLQVYESRKDNVVGVMTRYRLDGPVFYPRCGIGIFPSPQHVQTDSGTYSAPSSRYSGCLWDKAVGK